MAEGEATVPAWVLVWAEASAFLTEEARRLDGGDYEGWLSLLAPDIEYQAPVRSTRYAGDGSEFSSSSFHFDEDMFSLRMRVDRLATKFAWAEDPATRTRHFVANVAATATSSDQIHVRSDLLLRRSRLDEAVAETLTARREDELVRHDGELRLSTGGS